MRHRHRPRRGPLDESRYRERRTGSARFFTSRSSHDGLDAVVRRYPSQQAEDVGPTFVLVHGIGVSSRYFQPAAAELARLGSVYLVDLPGYGSAPKPKRPVTIADHARILNTVVEESGLVHPVLVGHSMGSQVVSQLAVDFPAVSDRIVLMAPTLYPPYRTLWVALGKLLNDIWREPWRVKIIATVDYLFRCGIPYFLQQVPFLLGDRMEDRISEISSRILVLRGDGDVIVPGAWARAMAELARQGTYDEVVGPHVVMFTDPVSVAKKIAAHAGIDNAHSRDADRA